MDSTDPTTDLPLAERAYRNLRQAIVRCEFEPGQRLRVDELSRRYDISSSPVREALSRLTEQGLVRSFDNRGFRVAPLSAEGIADLTRVRLLVESEALRESMTRGGDRWESDIVAAAHSLGRVEQRMDGGPLALDNDWSDRHRNFHLALYSGCQSPLLGQMVVELFDAAERYRRFSALHRAVDRHKHAEHQQLMERVLARDIDLALGLFHKHILGTERLVTQALATMRSAAVH
ncbi:FCD domain-containing protein [Curvibacter sp. RS43]|uniref:GntR family transcriptional regulator n=1 Tax=Curvibacter microcysteis TaxID=3026419 RepID=UPI0023618CBC|nr:GntR family transcriptional regulator [Curvibacter sp. RS43]MDD0812724.1 FCD domain-containing protein [Curvibacter sp. RS43]